MKWYSIAFPGEFGQHVEEIWNEDQILASYYPFWKERMLAAYQNDLVTHERCIEDWCTVHWAIEVEKPAWVK